MVSSPPSVTGVVVVGFANPVYAANLSQQAKDHQSLSPYGLQIKTYNTRTYPLVGNSLPPVRTRAGFSRGTRVADSKILGPIARHYSVHMLLRADSVHTDPHHLGIPSFCSQSGPNRPPFSLASPQYSDAPDCVHPSTPSIARRN